MGFEPSARAAHLLTQLRAFMDEVVERYAERTGFDVGGVLWCYAFGTFKLMVILQQIYIRYLRGQTQDPRFGDLGRRVESLANKGVTITKGGNNPKTASSRPY